MNPLVFGLVTWLLLGLQLGLAETLRFGASGPSPSFLLPLLGFACLHASPSAALWAALGLGALVDLTWSVPRDDGGAAAMLGPHALGYLIAAQAMISIRGSLIRRNPLTLAAVTSLAGAISGVFVVAVTTIRDFYDPLAWRPVQELLHRMGGAAYSGGLGLILAFALLPLTPMMGFPAQGPRSTQAMRRH